MPKSVENVVDQVANEMAENNLSVGSMSWKRFYALNEIERWKEGRAEELKRYAEAEHNLLVAFGTNVVIFSQDRNFAKLSL